MQKIGVGYERYKDFFDNDMYYVDKTLLIRDIVDKGGQTTLFTRPRRFGKTLALSMIRTFFELEYDFDGNTVDNRKYFEGRKIMGEREEILSMLGQYPVIKMSLKSAKQPDFYRAFMKIRDEITDEFRRHEYLLNSDRLSLNEISELSYFLKGWATWDEIKKELKNDSEEEKAFKEYSEKYSTAIKLLSALLKKHHGKNVIILIDEYDVPLENSYFRGFYPKMVDFIRSLFESALKTNDALERAVVTGCLRISKESIFTGLNNLEVYSVRGGDFGEYFGFTPEETYSLLKAYDLENTVDTVKKWYDGYIFGESEVYNPWSIIKFVKDQVAMPAAFRSPTGQIPHQTPLSVTLWRGQMRIHGMNSTYL